VLAWDMRITDNTIQGSLQFLKIKLLMFFSVYITSNDAKYFGVAINICFLMLLLHADMLLT
jgi:hypothetical protein